MNENFTLNSKAQMVRYDCLREKTEEYRNLGYYWNNRIWKDYQCVCFHRGYTNTTMNFIIKDIVIGFGKKEWGAKPKIPYFVIKLGRRVT